MSDDDSISVRLSKSARDWLKDNRGAGSMLEKADEVIEYYKENHKKPNSKAAEKQHSVKEGII